MLLFNKKKINQKDEKLTNRVHILDISEIISKIHKRVFFVVSMSIPNPLRSLNTPGQQVDIDCSHAGVDRNDLVIGLSWDFYPGTTPVDLDASAVCFDNLGVVQDAVYYNQLTAFNGALTHRATAQTVLATASTNP